MLLIYRFIYILVRMLLPLLHGFNPKVNKGYLLRLKKHNTWPWLNWAQKQQPVWIHCSSGEFEYALPMIRKIKKEKPQQKIMVTYFTPSYLKRIEAEPLVDFFCPAPWDQPGLLKEFIHYHQPKCLLIARTDFWPEMIEQCFLAKVPIRVFSMTFNKKLSGFKKYFFKKMIDKVEQLAVVSQKDKDLLATITEKEKIFVLGDTRYDQCLYRLAQKSSVKVDLAQLRKKIFVAGSTWPEDETVLIPIIAQTTKDFSWVIVPHEISISHLAKLKKQLTKNNIDFVLYSEVKQWNGSQLLIVDEFGLLAHLYKLAQVTFIGGSFKKQVHSVMESLACGCLTFVGPFYQNNREAVEFLNIKLGSLSAVQIINNQTTGIQIKALAHQWTKNESEELKKLIIQYSQATDKIYDWLAPLM